MRAARFTPQKGFQIEELSTVPLQADEVLLDVEACGVCGSDRQVVEGESVPVGTSFPLVMGHEIAGTIVQTGDSVTGWRTGAPVIVHPFIACGTCSPCLHGQSNLCIRQTCIGYQTAGGFAEQVVVPANQLVSRPKAMSAEAAALLVDAFATPYHAMREAHIDVGQTVLVIGTGGLGLASLRLLRAMGLERVGAVSRRMAGMDVAERHGATLAVSTEGDERALSRQLRRWSGSTGIDVVLDTIANEASVSLGLDVVRPGGIVSLVGMSDEHATFPIAKTVRRGVTLKASYGSTIQDVQELVLWVEEGRLDPSPLVAGTLTLGEIDQAFQAKRLPGRWVVTPKYH